MMGGQAVSPPLTPQQSSTMSSAGDHRPASPTSSPRLNTTPSRLPMQQKLRRKAPIADTLHATTAVQRLVEYFCVVSSQPRWERASNVEPVNDGNTEGRGSRRSHSRKKSRRWGKPEKSDGSTLSESRQETYSSESGDTSADPQHHQRGATDGNIHMLEGERDNSFQPKITARYPVSDHGDNPLNPMILQFCFPSGDVILPSRSYEMPRVHHFVLTNERGRRVYGTCLTFFEEYIPGKGCPWLSRMTCEEESDDGHGIELSVDHRRKALYIPKVLCLLSTWPYLTAFREYLAQLYRLASATDVMTAPIERYIVNLSQEIPAPPPGAYEVQVSILDSTIRFWAPPAKLPIAYVALPYEILFECLDLENVLQVWSALVVERKVLLLSSQYSILTVCSEILCSLLFPMRWSHLYIPLLPRMLCPMLDAPVPYMCGVVRDDWLHAQQFVSGDTIVVDLDRNSVIFGDMVQPLPMVPAKKWNKLHASLTEIAGHIFWRARGLETEYRAMMDKKPHKRSVEKLLQSQGSGAQWTEKLASFDHAFNLAYTPDSPNLLNDTLSEDEQSQMDRAQEAFLRFFVALLKDYRKHLSLPPASSTGNPRRKPSFNTIEFIARQKIDNIAFLTEMCMTQQFDDFLTRRMYSPGEPDLVFFDQSIDAKLNRSKLKIKKIETPFLQSAKVHKELKKLYALPPNEENLTDYDFERILHPYIYKSWPDTFDESLFCTPRPIPRMISAEFDRQANLVSKLRATVVDEEEDEGILEFYGGDYDPSPEVAAFTVFLFAYSALVGRDWQEYAQKRREKDAEKHQRQQERVLDDLEQREGVSEEIETVLPSFEVTDSDRDAADGFLSDLSMGFCDSCPEDGVLTLKSTLIYIGNGAGDACSSMFQKTAGQVAEIQLQLGAQENRNVAMPDGDDDLAEYEEAREVAAAQLDLAFETLSTMSLRGLSVDSDAYLSLMEACGRVGDTNRALQLIELMKNDGFVADSEVLACFVSAFAHDDIEGIDIGSPVSASPEKEKSVKGPDAYSRFLKKRFDAVKGEDKQGGAVAFAAWKDSCLIPSAGDDWSSVDLPSDESSQSSDWSAKSPTGGAAFLDWFTQHHLSSKEKKRRRRRRRKSAAMPASMPVTEMLSRQLALGESILDFLYPNLSIDTNNNPCPHCSFVLSEDNVVCGWTPCAFQDYTTKCPKCQHRFVPQFVVTCSSPDFEGSQGHQTPLYCEFLSPWVVRKELQHIIKGDIGIAGMLSPEWRSGSDIQATLFWNLMVLSRRYRTPFSFLLQGSFQNRLILPRKPDQMV